MVEFIKQLATKKLAPSQSNAANSGNVTVICRFRPFNEKEIKMGAKPVVDFD